MIPGTHVEQVRQIRHSFACGERRSDWDAAINAGIEFIRAEVSAEARVSMANPVSYHMFLLDGDVGRAAEFLAWIFRLIFDSGDNGAQTGLLDVARARLSRNTGDLAAAAKHLRRDSADPTHSAEAPFESKAPEWRLEYAHLLRHLGAIVPAFEVYRELENTEWHPLGRAYQSVLLDHYKLSTLCDQIQYFALPARKGSNNHRELLDEYLRQAHSVIEVHLGQLDTFPFFLAQYHKHNALVLALKGDLVAARDDLARATDVMEQLQTAKGISLCKQFRGMIEAYAGNNEQAATIFASLTASDDPNFGRLKAWSTFDLARLHFLARDNSAGERALAALRQSLTLEDSDGVLRVAVRHLAAHREPLVLPAIVLDRATRFLQVVADRAIQSSTNGLGSRDSTADQLLETAVGRKAPAAQEDWSTMDQVLTRESLLRLSQHPSRLNSWAASTPELTICSLAVRCDISVWLSANILFAHVVFASGVKTAHQTVSLEWLKVRNAHIESFEWRERLSHGGYTSSGRLLPYTEEPDADDAMFMFRAMLPTLPGSDVATLSRYFELGVFIISRLIDDPGHDGRRLDVADEIATFIRSKVIDNAEFSSLQAGDRQMLFDTLDAYVPMVV